ncbi:sensor histidine kinase [Paenibacillus mucilaginosus]|uniref:Putative sensor with HAMP domain n=1 Tax=Paenibacillus mucilaginosus (strain KNP414) TaxID=1036673 RepID=F8FG28_PAEMK|nr:sensor histidine kinase [Paenibacillus mucilaginosus]AEI43290.1 putative sensor with HAMP domain [Paenibacillus mucilaginosus KNP414]MCG7212155.1 sensor histidine kinase [Paenibacillus mucilaginosus]WDM24872.1 sensor histidine kinase [Paenibacillus mucilaginosus]
MPVKGSIFSKMIVLIVVLLLPVILLYIYFNHVAESHIRREIEQSTFGRLRFFLSQVETKLEQMSYYSAQIARDPTMSELQASGLDSDAFSKWKSVSSLSEKLRLLSSSSPWENHMNLYFPETKEVISTDGSPFDEALFETPLEPGWVRRKFTMYGTQVPGFVYYLIEPASYRQRPRDATFVIEVGFPERSLVSMLDEFKAGGPGDPFFYRPGTMPIRSRTSEGQTVPIITGTLLSLPEQHSWTQEIRTENGSFLVYLVYSERLGMYLADYYPEKLLLSSVHNSRTIFYLSIASLLLISLIGSLLFHRHVQTPVRVLVRAVQRLKQGDYSYRIRHRGEAEFEYLFDRYNGMAAELQMLIEHVYEEKLRSREAVLKQLQSQINPHFLYNSLNTIKTMSILGNVEAVESMIVNLGDFYRYTTRTEKRLAAVREEAEFVRSYLSIQQLRMPRLSFDIDIPQEMETLEIPRILLQPIVENAVVHGIENRLGAGIVEIRGELEAGWCRLIVSDNGKGLSGEALASLELRLQTPLTENTGCGLWNVHQRLQLEFGPESGISFSPSPLGGLCVELKWPVSQKDRKELTARVPHSAG